MMDELFISHVQICAEAAYNDTFLRSCIDEVYLTENVIIDKIVELGKKCIDYIKGIIERIKNFFSNFINSIKATKATVKAAKEFADDIDNISDEYWNTIFNEDFVNEMNEAMNQFYSQYSAFGEGYTELNEASGSKVVYCVDYSPIFKMLSSIDFESKSGSPSRLAAQINDIIDKAKSGKDSKDLINIIDKYRAEAEQMEKMTIAQSGINLPSKYASYNISDLDKALKLSIIDEAKKNKTAISRKGDLKKYYTNLIQNDSDIKKIESVFNTLKDNADKLISDISKINGKLNAIYKADHTLDKEVAAAARIFMNVSVHYISNYIKAYTTVLVLTQKAEKNGYAQYNTLVLGIKRKMKK